jgi:hypothetical protein
MYLWLLVAPAVYPTHRHRLRVVFSVLHGRKSIANIALDSDKERVVGHW